ncbi:PQQ-binding-like beta-propeller repeat protein [Stratiformator vulcanicus]|nr:PQQ-binding-like beta-propeller repeat protein [Stratiformator vulcanicus]
MKNQPQYFLSVALGIALSMTSACAEEKPTWNQWRGSNRDGIVAGNKWPQSLGEDTLAPVWRKELPPSYSGPVLSRTTVFTTATENRENEVAYAFDRKSGEQLWRTQWPGAMTVPFFAAANGSWIRATPAFDGNSLFVAGMRDVLVSLDAKTGEIQWQADFVKRLDAPLPAFGFASSPLLDGQFLYVQAGAAFLKVDKATGDIVWKTLEDREGRYDSAFSSPTFGTIGGKRQLIVQTRQKLAGVNPDNGKVLWEQNVPSYRGMNILTPQQFGDSFFTSSYRNKSWLFNINSADDKFDVTEAWSSNVAGYMSSPVVIGDHVYLHLQNQRFTCFNLRSGEREWTSQPFGKYCSLIAQGDQILALDERGVLLLIKANPQEFELAEERRISDEQCWAHVAVDKDQVFVRELNGLSSFRWDKGDN